MTRETVCCSSASLLLLTLDDGTVQYRYGTVRCSTRMSTGYEYRWMDSYSTRFVPVRVLILVFVRVRVHTYDTRMRAVTGESKNGHDETSVLCAGFPRRAVVRKPSLLHRREGIGSVGHMRHLPLRASKEDILGNSF